MHHSAHKQSGARRPRRRAGFTLIELLTVVAIIGLLVGMVVPTIQSVLEAMTAARTLARIKTLSSGIHGWKMQETGNKFFPGQQDPTAMSRDYPGKASAFLARQLFGDYQEKGRDGKYPKFPPPVDGYVSYEPGMLDTANGDDTGEPYTILDCHSDTMAILYYVSRRNASGKAQYVPGDNSFYTDQATGEGVEEDNPMDIQDWVGGGEGNNESKYGVKMDGQFILTAAGKDRLYFSATALDNAGQ